MAVCDAVAHVGSSQLAGGVAIGWVVGVGAGVFNFYGEVHDKLRSPVSGNPGIKVNVATFIDNKHYFRGNVFVLLGSLSGNERSLTDSALNRNFSSDLMSFGFNIHYDFRVKCEIFETNRYKRTKKAISKKTISFS